MVLLHLAALLLQLTLSRGEPEWELPALPALKGIKDGNEKDFPSLVIDKLVPRHLWMAVRDKKEAYNAQMPGLFERNRKWLVHVEGNHEKDLFMNTTFAGTSTLWAYHVLSPVVGAAKADIWRYCVLWYYGGAYVDDDSDMKVPLDNMVEPLDSLIVSYESNGFNADRCYVPTYHLSDAFVYDRNTTAKKLDLFHSRVLLNWAIVSAPLHPVIARTIENLVEIIRLEYLNEPVLRNLNAAYRWSAVMCATGPSLMTASAREVVLRNPATSYKLAKQDFRDYGGKFKAIYVKVRDDPKHYMNMHKNKAPLLSHYLPEATLSQEMLLSWEGKCVQGQNGKEIFVMQGGRKRGLPNYDTFLALNLTMSDVRVISDKRVGEIPLGPLMEKLDYNWHGSRR